MKAIATLMALICLSAASAQAAGATFEPIHGIGWKKTYAAFENGNCALRAQGSEDSDGQQAVVLTLLTSENGKANCQAEGQIYGVFACSSERTSEAKALGHSPLCIRHISAGVKERVHFDGLTRNLQLIQIDNNSAKNKYYYFRLNN